MTIKNIDQKVDQQTFGENFDRIFRKKKSYSGKSPGELLQEMFDEIDEIIKRKGMLT